MRTRQCRQNHVENRESYSRISPKDHPVFFVFGHYHRFLNLDEASSATPEERITSVWPFVVKQVSAFISSLHQRELVNFDADDVLIEVWIELRQKDCKWDPRIGTYISFAGKIIHHLFVRIRERSRTVESPRNATCRLKECISLLQSGKNLTEARSKNRNDILRTINGTSLMGEVVPEYEHHSSPESDCLGQEHEIILEDAVKRSVSALSPLEAFVLGRLHGLWGNESQTLDQVAKSLRKTHKEVARIRDKAYKSMRDFLESEFHASSQEYS